MSYLKQLAGQTAIYGLGTIIPRLMNYLLMTPFYTRVFQKGEYGVVTELYAYAALLMVLLTYGMETTFFRYSEKETDRGKVYGTTLISILVTSVIFIISVTIFSKQIAGLINYSSHSEYIIYFGLIIGLDAFTSIPFARLRQQNRAFKFAMIKIINVSVQVGLNLWFLWICPKIAAKNPGSALLMLYSPHTGVGYAFISNMTASIITVLLLLPEIFKIRIRFDGKLLRRMLNYSFPILIVGLLGMFNDVSDKIFLKYLWPDKAEALKIVGIYGANFKLAVLLTIFTQMFRYAVEPFFFAKAKEENSKEIYAEVMKYFVISGLLIFLGVTLFIDFTKYFIGSEYWEGLKVVPIILFAKLLFGITINLSIWYKITDKTHYGAIINLSGTLVVILVNVLFIPVFGYMASAWGQLLCYFTVMNFSYFLMRKHFRIDYDLKTTGGYVFLALIIYFIGKEIIIQSLLLSTLVKLMLFTLFASIIFIKERRYFYK